MCHCCVAIIYSSARGRELETCRYIVYYIWSSCSSYRLDPYRGTNIKESVWSVVYIERKIDWPEAWLTFFSSWIFMDCGECVLYIYTPDLNISSCPALTFNIEVWSSNVRLRWLKIYRKLQYFDNLTSNFDNYIYARFKTLTPISVLFKKKYSPYNDDYTIN